MNIGSEKIAKIISFAFNPLIIPTLGILMIFYSGTYLSYIPLEGKKLILTVIFSGTFLIPVSFIPLLLYLKVIDNIEVNNPSQRLLPLIITGIIYCCTYYVVRRMPLMIINIFILGSIICIILNTIIITKWKISSHLIAAGGLVGLALGLIFRLNADMPVLLITSILIAGLLGFARLRLLAHTPAQVYTGFFLGLFIVSGLLLLV
jgi:hypothetical protein